MGSQRSGLRSAEQRPRRQGQAGEQAPTLTRRGRCEGSRPRRGCLAAGAKGERDAAAESDHRRRRPPGFASCWDRSRIGLRPLAGASLSAQPAAHVTSTERPRGREAGAGAGLSGRGAGRLGKGRVFMGKRRGPLRGGTLRSEG